MLDKDFHIVIIGRPNVGKSTLFNRLTGSKEALVFDRPGVTRDIRKRATNILGKRVVLFDSPGAFDYDGSDNDHPLLTKELDKKVKEALEFANLVLFVIDGKQEITEFDKDIAISLRSADRDFIIVVNKSEKKSTESNVFDAFEFGAPDVIPISAEHNLGLDFLLETVSRYIPEQFVWEPTTAAPSDRIRLSIVGRPNVGKSTLINRLIGEKVKLAIDLPGLTRELSGSFFEFNDRLLVLTDTPGTRKKAKISDDLEKISAALAKKAYREADIVILVVDATTLESGEVEKQDLAIASEIISIGKPILIAFNKCDQTPYNNDTNLDFLKRVFKSSLSQLKSIEFVFISALHGLGLNKMLNMALALYDQQLIKIKTSELNSWLSSINKSEILQNASSNFKLKYINQISKNPPTFLIFTARKRNIKLFHEKFILNNLKKSFDLTKIPVKVVFKEQQRRSFSL
jgi:GTP-binding protein